MERRVLIAVFLSFIVLYAYQALFTPAPPPRQTQPPSPSAGPSAPAATPSPGAEQPPQTSEPAITPVKGDTAEREIIVETTTVRAVFTNRGARIKSWQLKEYRDDNGQSLDLVPSQLPPDQPLPFSLRVDDGEMTRRLNTALYQLEGETRSPIDATREPVSLVFEFQDNAGLRARKEFRLEPTGYLITFSPSVTAGDRTLNPLLQWGLGLGDQGSMSGGGSFFTGNYVQPPQAIFHTGDDVERIPATSVAEQPVHEGTFRFAGVDDHYFMAAAVNPGQVRVEYRAVALPLPNSTSERQLLAHTLRFPQPPQTVRYFYGPKAFDTLQAVDGELVRAIHFGIFAWLAVPLLGALKWIYEYIGNYGWAIIILTVLINLAIFPLRHKSVVSMRKMQELQPQLKAIQDRYKNLKVTDPARQKMNTEVMNLYRERGVNPASGCVPMLLTLPVLLAFYSLLSQAIELRGAEFGWWIKDLSRMDPYYVTPILMGATMFWQQKITPSTADPAQQRIMLMMPLIFSVMFLSAPSGLAIYWFVSNLWAIGQQYFTNWLIGPPTPHAPRPPAERRLKNVGAGRTQAAEKRS
jgi:YidC/Oxa1 family membrane protein insertase